MKPEHATIILTGASGFVGRHFIEQNKEHYNIIAIARRSRQQADIPTHQNVHWLQWDISNAAMIPAVVKQIKEYGTVDYVIHLAAFYDFKYDDNPEYQRTNVNGTRNILELSRTLGIRHFVFASSLVVSNFRSNTRFITEQSPADADFSYARTKKAGEEMVKEYSKFFSCSVVRFAAVFSDWCEYAVLYKFLDTWLSRKWNSRILGGKGESAVTYIHINDLVKLLNTILARHHSLKPYDIYIASPDLATSHKELFQIATRDYFGMEVKPRFIPKLIAAPAVVVRAFLGRLKIGPDPFERPWMMKYIDLKLNVDASYTRQTLEWEPTPRYHVLRRLLFLLNNLKSHPKEWLMKNEAAMKHVARRANLTIYEHMVMVKERVLQKFTAYIFAPDNNQLFQNYQKLDPPEFQNLANTFYHMLLASVHSGDRNMVKDYMSDIAFGRFDIGFTANEISRALSAEYNFIFSELMEDKELLDLRQELYDYVSMTIQLAQDEVEDMYDSWKLQVAGELIEKKKKVNLLIDGVTMKVDEGTTILNAAKKANINVPTLCYHVDLKVAGNCRICVVEQENRDILVASCATPCEEGMVIHTNSLKVRTVRKHVIELLLSEHASDCTNCYINGNCELQDLASEFKTSDDRFINLVPHKNYIFDNLSPAIVKDDSKCIRCQRCVRTCTELQSVGALAVAYRGSKKKISTFLERSMVKVICTNCGQCVTRCPAGALVEKDYVEEVWRAIYSPHKHVVVQAAPAVRVSLGEILGMPPGKRVTGKLVSALKKLGFDAVLDTNFSADLVIIEETAELLERLKSMQEKSPREAGLPMFTSCCPAWIKFIEHTYPAYLSHLSSCKSPQQMFGALCKSYYAKNKGLRPNEIVSVSIMPCTAKKFEADRPEMRTDGFKDVDYVLTTRELAVMIRQAGIDFQSLTVDSFDSMMGKSSGAGMLFGTTGGVAEAALRTAYETITGREIPYENLNIVPLRGQDGIREMSLTFRDVLQDWHFLEGFELKTVVAHSLSNAHRVVQSVIEGKKNYHFIEVMACQGGCLGGGGQPMPTSPEIRKKRTQAVYAEDMGLEIRKSHDNPEIIELYREFLTKPLSGKAEELLHTDYLPRPR
ncbi:MAG TPA: NADH-dependent [FeFe] hydrogenase, group A6 [Bacteroidales bacterium]|nr:NADH-dependent [FeFe] hydrogenase, group A6 [Bacteroidales bacterium]HSA42426.1 NADH-dependent [FeFe] hydrogenase, group A6 [Bacteroidales bacterium]